MQITLQNNINDKINFNGYIKLISPTGKSRIIDPKHIHCCDSEILVYNRLQQSLNKEWLKTNNIFETIDWNHLLHHRLEIGKVIFKKELNLSSSTVNDTPENVIKAIVKAKNAPEDEIIECGKALDIFETNVDDLNFNPKSILKTQDELNTIYPNTLNTQVTNIRYAGYYEPVKELKNYINGLKEHISKTLKKM